MPRPRGRPRRENPITETLRWEARAKDRFLRAAAALTEPATEEHIAFALEEAAIGLHYLAKADHDERGLRRLEARIAAITARHAEEAEKAMTPAESAEQEVP